jgi:DNA-binding protein YbaB
MRSLLYVPTALGMGRIHFLDRHLNTDESQNFRLLGQPSGDTGSIRWEDAQPVDVTEGQLLDRPEPDARFGELTESLNESEDFSDLKKNLLDHLYRNSSLKLLYSSALKTYSSPNESERDFRTRLTQSTRERRDAEVDNLNARYETRMRTLQDRLRRAQATVAQKLADAQAHKQEIMVSVGESVLGMFLGRRSMRAASTAMSKYHQRSSAEMRAQQAQESVDALQKEIAQLNTELQQQADAITARWDAASNTFEEVSVRPSKSDIEVDMLALAWAPHWQIAYHNGQGNSRTDRLRAY